MSVDFATNPGGDLERSVSFHAAEAAFSDFFIEHSFTEAIPLFQEIGIAPEEVYASILLQQGEGECFDLLMEKIGVTSPEEVYEKLCSLSVSELGLLAWDCGYSAEIFEDFIAITSAVVSLVEEKGFVSEFVAVMSEHFLELQDEITTKVKGVRTVVRAAVRILLESYQDIAEQRIRIIAILEQLVEHDPGIFPFFLLRMGYDEGLFALLQVPFLVRKYGKEHELLEKLGISAGPDAEFQIISALEEMDIPEQNKLIGDIGIDPDLFLAQETEFECFADLVGGNSSYERRFEDLLLKACAVFPDEGEYLQREVPMFSCTEED